MRGSGEEGGSRRQRRYSVRTAARRVVALHAQEQPSGGHGCSFSLLDGDVSGADLYAVSPYELCERRIPGGRISLAQAEAYIRRFQDLLRKSNHVLGTWWDAGEDVTYVDVSVLVQDESEARVLADQHGQKAYFHLASKKTIDLE